MASPMKIILILACASLAECRLRGKFKKEITSLNEHKIQEEITNSVTERQVVSKIKTSEDLYEAKTSRDEDMIVFPKDQDTRIYLDVNKIIRETFNKLSTNNQNNANTIYVPLLPKVVPALEAKEAFTNPIILNDEEIRNKTKEDKENIEPIPNPIEEFAEAKVAIDAIIEGYSNITLDSNATVGMGKDTSSSNETVPDFSNRFGVTGNYIIVPANNVQTYQAVQVPNVPVQGNVQQHGTYSGQGNIINALNTNAAPARFTPDTNINNPNSQYLQSTNVLQNPYAPNANVNYNGIQEGTVPITVGNTYTINGQLYAAVTVPNNVNVPSSVYLMNSQQQGPGYQVNSNLPLYKMVSVGHGDQGNVNQYVPINRNGNNQYVPVNGNGNNQYLPINGNVNNQYEYVPINGNDKNQYVPINGNENNEYVPINGNRNNQYAQINEGIVNNQYPIN